MTLDKVKFNMHGDGANVVRVPTLCKKRHQQLPTVEFTNGTTAENAAQLELITL